MKKEIKAMILKRPQPKMSGLCSCPPQNDFPKDAAARFGVKYRADAERRGGEQGSAQSAQIFRPRPSIDAAVVVARINLSVAPSSLK